MRRDHVHAEGIVARFKWLSGSASGDILEHGCFYLKKAHVAEIAPDFGNHAAALEKDLAGTLVRNEIEVALAVFDLRINNAVKLVRHRAQGLGENRDYIRFDRRFSDFGRKRFAFNADPVADIELLVGSPILFADLLLVYENLDATVDVGDVEKIAFSHVAQSGDSSGDADLLFLFKIFAESGRRVGDFELLTERINAHLAERIELLAANFQEFAKVFIVCGWIFL